MKEPGNNDCHVEPAIKKIDRRLLKTAVAARLAISGMGCENCAARVRNGLLSLDGVLAAEVSAAYGIGAVAYDPTRVFPMNLIEAIAIAARGTRHEYAGQLVEIRPAAEYFAS